MLNDYLRRLDEGRCMRRSRTKRSSLGKARFVETPAPLEAMALPRPQKLLDFLFLALVFEEDHCQCWPLRPFKPDVL